MLIYIGEIENSLGTINNSEHFASIKFPQSVCTTLHKLMELQDFNFVESNK